MFREIMDILKSLLNHPFHVPRNINPKACNN